MTNKQNIENAIADLESLLALSRGITINGDKMPAVQIEADSAMISAIAARTIEALKLL